MESLKKGKEIDISNNNVVRKYSCEQKSPLIEEPTPSTEDLISLRDSLIRMDSDGEDVKQIDKEMQILDNIIKGLHEQANELRARATDFCNTNVLAEKNTYNEVVNNVMENLEKQLRVEDEIEENSSRMLTLIHKKVVLRHGEMETWIASYNLLKSEYQNAEEENNTLECEVEKLTKELHDAKKQLEEYKDDVYL